MCALAVTLVLGLGCFPSHAVGLGEGDTGATLGATPRTEGEVDELVRSMTSSGDYVEGEAIACFLGAETKTTPGVRAQSEDLLASAQTQSSVTARQYVEATGETIPAAAGQGMLTSQSEDEPVRILKVCDYSLSTQELLRALLGDPRVLSAEPNYVMDFATVDDHEQGDEEHKREESSANLEPSAQQDGNTHVTTTNLTDYQWFSEGAGNATPQYPSASNPGIHAPHWNDPSQTNAGGVVAIMDSGVDYTHPDRTILLGMVRPRPYTLCEMREGKV